MSEYKYLDLTIPKHIVEQIRAEVVNEVDTILNGSKCAEMSKHRNCKVINCHRCKLMMIEDWVKEQKNA